MNMKKLSVVLVFFLMPTVAWNFVWALPNNQKLSPNMLPPNTESSSDEIVTKTDLENFLLPSSLETRTGSPEAQNLEDREKRSGKGEEEESWTIGNIHLIIQPKAHPPLKIRSTGRASLESYDFVGKVGGVNFEQVATPAAETAAKSIELFYDRKALNGFRLVIKVGSATFRPPLADWLLIPIAEFANSEFTSATSLFGEGPDSDNFYYIKYHPAFIDSLLGIRLLQADLLLMNPKQTNSLPMKNGQVVLGHGEFLPMKTLNQEILQILGKLMGNQKATSWVLTDIEAPASFSIQGGQFQIHSSPYYYFWRKDEDFFAQYQEKENPL